MNTVIILTMSDFSFQIKLNANMHTMFCNAFSECEIVWV